MAVSDHVHHDDPSSLLGWAGRRFWLFLLSGCVAFWAAIFAGLFYSFN